MQSITDKLAAALLECSDYLAEFMEEGREHRVIRAADDALAEYDAVKGPIDSAPLTYSLSEIRNGTGWPKGVRFAIVKEESDNV